MSLNQERTHLHGIALSFEIPAKRDATLMDGSGKLRLHTVIAFLVLADHIGSGPVHFVLRSPHASVLRLRGGGEDGDGGPLPHAPPSASEALAAMKACTEAAKHGEQDLVDGYALLQSMKARGEPIGIAVYHEMFRLCIQVVREEKAATQDGEKILEEVINEGYVPTYETYELLMEVILEGAKQNPQRGYLSEGYDLLERMEEAGLKPRNETYELYNRIYAEQWPNVVEIDEPEYNWCVFNEEEERLWRGDPELGIPPDPSCDPKNLIHVKDIKNIPLSEADKSFYERMERREHSPSYPSTSQSSSSF